MEFFPDGNHVWLQNCVRGTYLHADEDGVGVSLRRRRATLNAAWRVHLIVRNGTTYVLLHSAAYGRYLALSPGQAPRGHRGRRAIQRDYDAPDLDAVMWEAFRVADGDDDVLVRHVSNSFLRGNGRYRIWHIGVTVDSGHRSTMMHWMVEAIPPRPAPPLLPDPPLIPEVDCRRTIRFRRVNNLGNLGRSQEVQFYGRSVSNLRSQLATLMSEESLFSILMCVRPGFYGRLTPLVIDLPHSGELMDIVVLSTVSQGENFAVFSVSLQNKERPNSATGKGHSPPETVIGSLITRHDIIVVVPADDHAIIGTLALVDPLVVYVDGLSSQAQHEASATLPSMRHSTLPVWLQDEKRKIVSRFCRTFFMGAAVTRMLMHRRGIRQQDLLLQQHHSSSPQKSKASLLRTQ
ncbi:uncharacterized protein LOC133930262 [Phragmites australis]|uniref:uncharacterized protein LOC133930262 n=1 Tax=Phragmites australis TaxID=29695 RepID=UPI002D798BD4|nr:uncharacterized protein LOC133930262 [Phragmites australis]